MPVTPASGTGDRQIDPGSALASQSNHNGKLEFSERFCLLAMRQKGVEEERHGYPVDVFLWLSQGLRYTETDTQVLD